MNRATEKYHRPRHRRGTALVASIVVMATIIGIWSAMITLTVSDARMTLFHKDTVRATYLAEGANEIVQKQVLQSIASYLPVASSGTVELDGVPISFTVDPIQSSRVEVDDDEVQTLYQPYEITTTATWGGYEVSVHKIVDVGKTPIFQYAVFYQPDLEILPGPSMTLSGRVHSNHDLYIGTNGTLTINSNYLRAVGDIFRRRKNSDDSMLGPVRVKVKGQSIFLDMECKNEFDADGIPSVSGFDSDFEGYDQNGDGDLDDEFDVPAWTAGAMERWNGTVRTKDHGLREIAVPSVQCTEPFVKKDTQTGNYDYNPATGWYEEVPPGTGWYHKGYYNKQAGLVIVQDRVYDTMGNDITAQLPEGTITQDSMFDGREEKVVQLTQIDMALLNESGRFPANGLLYACRTDCSAAYPNGIRVKNAAELHSGLTIVSPNPVYVWGDYNSVNKKPASVITDAVNLLSNAWGDTKQNGQLPYASNTTYNLAFISGSYASEWGQYNGGFENMPRFHENWDGKVATIRGSFVNIWESKYAKGPWIYGNDNYTAPYRNWDYDTGFNDPSNLPPFTPISVSCNRVAWWTE